MNITLGFLPSLMLWRAWRIGNTSHITPMSFSKDIFYAKYKPELEFDILPTSIDTVLPAVIPRNSSCTWKTSIAQTKELIQRFLSIFELEEDVYSHVSKHKSYSVCSMQYFNQYTHFHQTTAYLQPIRFYYDFHCELPILLPNSHRGIYASVKSMVNPTHTDKHAPIGSFYEVVSRYKTFGSTFGSDTHIYVLSPSYLLVYAAQYLNKIASGHTQSKIIQVHNMLRLMCELTGTYTYDPLFEEETIYNVNPLCSVTTLKKFCADYYSSPQQTLYGLCCSLALDGLASPFETTVALALSLPEKYGGINLGAPAINHMRILENINSTVLHKSITPDIYFANYHLAIECNGETFHNTKEGYKEDHRRARDYAALGDVYLPVVYSDIHTVQNLQLFLSSTVDACLKKENISHGSKLLKRVERANKNHQQDILVKIHS